MEASETRLEGPILIQPRVLGDERGFFCETYRREVFAELGISEEMVQDNHSRSRRGSSAECTSRSVKARRSWFGARAERSST